MSIEKRANKKDAGMEIAIKDLRQQLSDQLRCLDNRVELQTSLLVELQEFFRRRADVELEYGRGLDKLHRALTQRHKDLRQRREQVQLFSSYAAWQQLTAQTRQEANHRAALGDIYATVLPQKMARLSDDLQTIYKRCRQICTDSHEELMKLITELQAATKTYNNYYTHFSSAEAKLQYVVNQKAKLEVNLPEEKLDKSRKFRLVEKEIVKRRNKYQATRLQALRARNDFILCLEAANAAVHRYFSEDVPDVMDCSDVGVHTVVEAALRMAAEGTRCVVAGEQRGVEAVLKSASALDARVDKQRFIEANSAPFLMPRKFEFVACKGDIMSRYDVDPAILEETQQRYDALCRRIDALRAATDEQWKTVETAERSLLAQAGTPEVDCAAMFEVSTNTKPPELQLAKQRADHVETGQFYVSKFAEYVAESALLTRLQVKRETLRSGLAEHTPELGERRPTVARGRRARLGQAPAARQPRLFGGDLQQYLQTSGQQIPLIVRSCVRVINLYGLHHQGIFRVSGSQVEINSFRESFERGEDPLADVTDASDINSVAGVLKLYLRELREPFFPTVYFEQLMQIAQLPSAEERTARLHAVVHALPHGVQIVMRYLFAFLNHLSEFSDENMMEPYNLAICFGPTLLPIPETLDQVQYQNQVNELMKHIILHHEAIFPRGGGAVYEKYLSREEAEDVGEAPSAGPGDEPDLPPSEDDSLLTEKERELSLRIFGKSEQLEAVAQFDFTARSPRELSFRCGDVLTLYRQVSSDWWRGAFRGQDGLVPDKYIMLRIRDEDRAAAASEPVSRRAGGSGAAPAGGRPGHSSGSTLSSASSQSTLLETAGAEERAWLADRSATLPRGGPPTPAPRAASLVALRGHQDVEADEQPIRVAGQGAGQVTHAAGRTEIYVAGHSAAVSSARVGVDRVPSSSRVSVDSGSVSLPATVGYGIDDTSRRSSVHVVTTGGAELGSSNSNMETVGKLSPRQRVVRTCELETPPAWSRQIVNTVPVRSGEIDSLLNTSQTMSTSLDSSHSRLTSSIESSHSRFASMDSSQTGLSSSMESSHFLMGSSMESSNPRMLSSVDSSHSNLPTISSMDHQWTDEEDNSVDMKDSEGEDSEPLSGDPAGGELEQAVREIALVSERLRQVELDLDHLDSDPPPPPAPESARARPRRSLSGATPALEAPQKTSLPPPASASSVMSRRALWETRAAAESPPPSLATTAGLASLPAGSRRALKHTPDLVMDLPAEWGGLQRSGSASSEEGGGALTPSTAAETFARQNQCTVKRSGRLSPLSGGGGRSDSASEPTQPAPPVRRPSATHDGVSVTERAGLVARSLSAVHSQTRLHGASARPGRPVSAVYVPSDGGGGPARAASGAQRPGRPAGGVDTLAGAGAVTVEHTNPAAPADAAAPRPQARVKPQPARKPSPKHLKPAAPQPPQS